MVRLGYACESDNAKRQNGKWQGLELFEVRNEELRQFDHITHMTRTGLKLKEL